MALGVGGQAVYIAGGTLMIPNITSIGAIGAIGAVKNIEPIRFCHWNAPKEGAGGSLAEAAFYSAALIAVATINTIAQWDIAQKRYQIAKDYANIAKDRWERFRTGYMPLEISMLSEIMNTPLYEVNCQNVRNDYSNWFTRSYGETEARLPQIARSYRVGVDETLMRDLKNDGVRAVVDGINFGYRYEENRKIMKDDQRWNRRSNLLNLGRDLQAQSAKFASYANDILAGLSDMAGQGAAGAMQMLTYMRNRQETQYPTQFAGIGGLGDTGQVGMFAPAQIGMNWN